MPRCLFIFDVLVSVELIVEIVFQFFKPGLGFGFFALEILELSFGGLTLSV